MSKQVSNFRPTQRFLSIATAIILAISAAAAAARAEQNSDTGANLIKITEQEKAIKPLTKKEIDNDLNKVYREMKKGIPTLDEDDKIGAKIVYYFYNFSRLPENIKQEIREKYYDDFFLEYFAFTIYKIYDFNDSYFMGITKGYINLKVFYHDAKDAEFIGGLVDEVLEARKELKEGKTDGKHFQGMLSTIRDASEKLPGVNDDLWVGVSSAVAYPLEFDFFNYIKTQKGWDEYINDRSVLEKIPDDPQTDLEKDVVTYAELREFMDHFDVILERMVYPEKALEEDEEAEDENEFDEEEEMTEEEGPVTMGGK